MKKSFLIDKNGQLFFKTESSKNIHPAQCVYKNIMLIPSKIVNGDPSMQVPGCNNNCIFFDYDGKNKVTLNCTKHRLNVTEIFNDSQKF